MRRASVLLTAAVAAALALPVPATAGPVLPQAPPAGPVLTSVSLATGKVSVKGLDTVPVTVTVTATGYEGPCPANVGGVSLWRTSAQTWDRSATGDLDGPMFCVSANGDERTYRAVIPVPSTADGQWRVTWVQFANSYQLDPRTFGLPDATLAVTGRHRPRLRVSVRPQPLRYPARDVTVTVQATYDDDRTPVTTRWIGITDDGGGIAACGSCAGDTDAHGRLVRRLRLTGPRQVLAYMPLSALGFYDSRPLYSGLWTRIVVQPALTAAPAKDSVRHGTNVDVNGRAFDIAVQNWSFKPRIKVSLQRLVGKHWRTVSESTIRSSGRFTLLATPPKGRNLYRVGLPEQQYFASTHSRTFVIRGT